MSTEKKQKTTAKTASATLAEKKRLASAATLVDEMAKEDGLTVETLKQNQEDYLMIKGRIDLGKEVPHAQKMIANSITRAIDVLAKNPQLELELGGKWAAVFRLAQMT